MDGRRQLIDKDGSCTTPSHRDQNRQFGVKDENVRGENGSAAAGRAEGCNQERITDTRS